MSSNNYVFNSVPVLKHKRSRFDLSHSVKTSGNVGDLIPFDVQEVVPGDTFKVKTGVVSRLASQFIKPVMDNLFLDVYYFYVRSRTLYDKFVNVFGENTESAWANSKEYSVPTFSGTISPKSVGDYLGLPLGPVNDISVLPFRAFAKIYDCFFRDQNNIDPMHVQTGEIAASEVPSISEWSPNNYMGKLPKVAKFHDYFTSALPAPQKGTSVDLPVLQGLAPVRSYGAVPDPRSGGHALWFDPSSSSGLSDGQAVSVGARYSESNGLLSAISGPVTEILGNRNLYPANLWADLSDTKSEAALSVNDLRFAFQYQKLLERDARSGTRFVEYLASHFGVYISDSVVQRPEFLGGRRTPINITQVTQTTGSDSESAPLGQVGAYSQSFAKSRYVKSFAEPGYVIGVMCVRQFHTYQQGVEKFWTRKNRQDFYDPVFANIGEQPIMARELYNNALSGQVFGYQEAWADLRNRPARVSGQMRSASGSDSYDIWHFADNYSSVPVLSKAFIEETPQYVDRDITVPSTSGYDQFIFDIYIQNVAYRDLPTYSVPSLIDHN